MYSILNEENRIVNFRKGTDLKSLASIRIAYRLKEAGLENSSAGVLALLNDWVEVTQETEQPVKEAYQVVDFVAGNLVYSNIFFFHLLPNGDKIQLTSEEREEVYTWTVRLLDACIEKQKNK